MKTMTFSGRTMREAIAQAKARFGGDVDILDSDAVGDEVQVTVVVPMARSARRRRALEQVSASINALAASGRTAANGTENRTASVESRPTAPVVAATPAAAVAAPAVSVPTPASTEKSSTASASDVVKEAGPAVDAPDAATVTAPKAAGRIAADATAEPSAPGRKDASVAQLCRKRARPRLCRWQPMPMRSIHRQPLLWKRPRLLRPPWPETHRCRSTCLQPGLT